MKNTWDGVKLSHLYKVSFPTIKFIKSAAEGFPLKHFWTLDGSRTVSHEITLLYCKYRFTVVRIPEKYQKQSKVVTSLKSYIFHYKVYQRSLSFAGTLQGIFQWILKGLVLKTSLSRINISVAFDNTNFWTIITAYLTEPDDYSMKVTKFSATMIQCWEVSVKYLDEIAIALVRLKKPSREKFFKLWQIDRSAWKW